MNRLLAVAIKELRQIVRDPLSLALLLGVPAGMLLLYGFALNFDVRHVLLAVDDRDHSAESRELVAAFVQSGYFDLAGRVSGEDQARRATERREAKVVLVIPDGYAAEIAAGRTTSVQLLLDGTDATTAQTALSYASSLVERVNADLLLETLGPLRPAVLPRFEFTPRVWYNPELQSTLFLVPGLVGFIMMLTAVISTALSVVREKERGTLDQLRLTPLRPFTLILGKTLPYLAISLVAAAIILFTARTLFGVTVRGSYAALAVATLLYLLGALGWGLLVSSFADSQAMAFQVGSLTSMLPAIFLSGFIFPIRSMPEPLQWITYAVPARYYLIVLRGVILKGTDLSPYLEQIGFLAAYAAVVLGVAYARLVRRVA